MLKISTQVKQLLSAFIVLLLIILSGCSKEELNTDLKMEKPNSRSNLVGIFSAGDNLYDIVGYGYDVTGEYGNLSASRFKVIDINRLKQDYSDRVEVVPGVFQYTTVEAGANATDYSLELSGKFTGSSNFRLFKGTVYGSYKDATKISNKYSYARITQVIKQKTIKVNATWQMIRDNYLSPVFISDVNGMTPQQLVNAYGTHVLTNIILGAKLEVNYRSEARDTDKKKAATAGATATGIGGVFSITTDITYDESLVSKNMNQSLSYQTVGGDGSKGLYGEIDLDKPFNKVNIGNWQSTCTMQNATLIDITKDTSIPLHELISDPLKRQAVKDYIDIYLYDNQVRTLGDVPIFSYYSALYKDHIYSTNDKPFLEGATSYVKEGTAFYAFQTPLYGSVAIYSYYSPIYTDHIYSRNNKPFLEGSPSYVKEGIAFYAFENGTSETIPVYSYASGQWTDHIYSTNYKPFLEGAPSYVLEGIAFHVPN